MTLMVKVLSCFARTKNKYITQYPQNKWSFAVPNLHIVASNPWWLTSDTNKSEQKLVVLSSASILCTRSASPLVFYSVSTLILQMLVWSDQNWLQADDAGHPASQPSGFSLVLCIASPEPTFWASLSVNDRQFHSICLDLFYFPLLGGGVSWDKITRSWFWSLNLIIQSLVFID